MIHMPYRNLTLVPRPANWVREGAVYRDPAGLTVGACAFPEYGVGRPGDALQGNVLAPAERQAEAMEE